MNLDQLVETDVLVVGGGGAALRAAIAAADGGARVTVALKGQTGKSGATVHVRKVAWQCADGCSGDDDSPKVHYRNILSTGLGMADPRLARIQAYEIPKRTAELEAWGVHFVADPTGRKRHFAAHSCFGDQPRAHSVRESGGGHADDLVSVMVNQAKSRNIEVHENVFITDLLVQDGTCVGAMALDGNGSPLVYRSGAVFFGAGGARQVFPPHPIHRIDTTGDGYAMALRAGAELTNMEFHQYTMMPRDFDPSDIPGLYWAVFPKLRNHFGDEVLTHYLPEGVTPEQAMRDRCLHMPYSTRDASGWIDITVVKEVNAGRGAPEGGLYLDFSDSDIDNYRPEVHHHFDEAFNRKAVRPSSRARVVSTFHATNGGILINEQAESSLPGLFAAGEVCAGPHGADRLGGGMVSMSIVFGARAGRFAAERALQTDGAGLKDSTLAPALERVHAKGSGERDAEGLYAKLQESMGRDFLNVKSGPACAKLLEDIEEFRDNWLPELARDNLAARRRAIEAANSLQVAELMVRAALAREESRGNHFREDYPRQDDQNWRKNIIFQLVDGELHLKTRSRAEQDEGVDG